MNSTNYFLFQKRGLHSFFKRTRTFKSDLILLQVVMLLRYKFIFLSSFLVTRIDTLMYQV